MQKVLVTGATGYLGAKICLHLHHLGYHVVALCRNLSKYQYQIFKDITIIEGDIIEEATFQKLSKLDLQAIVHTVSLDHNLSETSSIDKVNQINVLATWKLIDLFSKQSNPLIIYFSTIHTLGKLPNETIDENFEPNPLNVYGLTHLFGENLINYYYQQCGERAISLRLTNGYGSPVFSNNNCWNLVINNLCKEAYLNQKIVLQSDGKALRDFIHVDDIANAVSLLMQQPTFNHSIFHVSSGRTYSLLELAFLVKKYYEKRYAKSIQVFHSKDIPINDYVELISNKMYAINNQRFKNIGFKIGVDIEQGIHDLFNYFEKYLKK